MRTKSRLVGEVVRYSSTTLLSAACSLGVPILLHEVFAIAEKSAAGTGFLLSYILNIILLRSFVFRSKNHWLRDVSRYVLATGFMRLFEFGAFVILLDYFGIDYRLSILLVLGLGTLIKFFVYRRAFGEKSPPGVDAATPPR